MKLGKSVNMLLSMFFREYVSNFKDAVHIIQYKTGAGVVSSSKYTQVHHFTRRLPAIHLIDLLKTIRTSLSLCTECAFGCRLTAVMLWLTRSHRRRLLQFLAPSSPNRATLMQFGHYCRWIVLPGFLLRWFRKAPAIFEDTTRAPGPTMKAGISAALHPGVQAANAAIRARSAISVRKQFGPLLLTMFLLKACERPNNRIMMACNYSSVYTSTCLFSCFTLLFGSYITYGGVN